jgi:hypothetical protein
VEKVKIKIVTTKHNTTPEEQWQKFLDELKEFYEARDNYFGKVVLTETVPQLTRDIVEEGLDCVKSARKYSDLVCCEQGKNRGFIYDFMFNYRATSTSFDLMEEKLQQFQNNKKSYIRADAFIQCMINYLYSFCKDNNLNFQQILKEHDEKLEKRGVKMKVYIDEGDLDMLDNLLWFDTVPDEFKKRLKRMIDEVEK